MTDSAIHPELAPNQVPDPADNALDALIAAELPASPIADFDALVGSLAQDLEIARAQSQARESERMHQAERLIEVLESSAAEAEEQLRRLDPLLAAFSDLGDLGAEGLARVMRAMEALRDHRAEVAVRLANPALQDAKRRRLERIQQAQAGLAIRLRPESTRDQIDATLTEILGSLDGSPLSWAEELVTGFEDQVRAATRSEHLPSISRFWKQLARRLEPSSSETALRFRERASQIDRDIQERDRQAAVRREAEELMEAVKGGIKGLSHLGPEEKKAQIALWLGRLRKLQDDHALDEEQSREIYLTFGRINSARKELQIDYYFDALNRNYSTDWDAYLEHWQSRLREARDSDLKAETLQRQAADEQRERELAAEAASRRLAEQLARATVALVALKDVAGVGSEREKQEEAREILRAGIEAGGAQSPDFIRAATPLASLIAQGNEFRSLRRALTRVGIDFHAVEPAPGSEEQGVMDEVVSRARAHHLGRTLAIIGGLPREEVRSAVEKSLGLREARWYEYYRGKGEKDAADSALRAGGIDLVLLLVRFAGHGINEFKDLCGSLGIPCMTVTSGCGTAAIVRALDHQ